MKDNFAFNAKYELNVIYVVILQSCGSNHPIIVLSNVSEEDLRALLKFMYNGQVQIAEDHLKDFLKTAEALQIRGLTDGTATRDATNITQSPIAVSSSD